MTGALQLADGAPRALLVCIHGGGCNRLYFDLKGYSVAAAARERGFAVLLVDRPGHGASEKPATGRPIEEAASLLVPFVAQVRQAHGLGDAPVALLGHSIGGAVAIMAAGAAGDFPIAGVAASAIGNRASPEAEIWFAQVLEGAGSPQPPASFFFGPENTYDWRGPAALRRCGETWQHADVLEIMGEWPGRFRRIAARVRVPVHLRLAEHEHIWDNRAAAIQDMAGCFRAAPEADAGLLPGGGHLYEVHRRGHELVAAQLDFVERCVTGR
jgi:pimeloyl-ACP methyl ester carboxylesterase